MSNKIYRYKDPMLSSYGKHRQKASHAPQSESLPPPSVLSNHSSAPSLFSLFSKNKLKSLDTDDYILMVLIFMLIKNSDEPDWPLIFSLFYILLDDNDG